VRLLVHLCRVAPNRLSHGSPVTPSWTRPP
jgi:hypothetical protein